MRNNENQLKKSKVVKVALLSLIIMPIFLPPRLLSSAQLLSSKMMDSWVNLLPRFHMNNNVKRLMMCVCCLVVTTSHSWRPTTTASHNSGVYRTLMTAYSPLTSRNPGELHWRKGKNMAKGHGMLFATIFPNRSSQKEIWHQMDQIWPGSLLTSWGHQLKKVHTWWEKKNVYFSTPLFF